MLNTSTQTLQVQGPAGLIELAVDQPSTSTPMGVALIAHPHPLFGGSLHNKVVQTMARAFVQAGWKAVRFNFRGVGKSEGSHDHGHGEVDDWFSVLEHVAPQGPFAVAGFSFGAYVTAAGLTRLNPSRAPEHIVLVGTAASRFQVPPIPTPWHERTLVVHGETDDTVPLPAVMDWARPQSLPVTVVPGVEHFFHGQLPLLKGLVLRQLQQHAH
jgi:alpha/beta superfamily hydrolase